ncbi:MAG: maleylpyruvate isomerase family mycothiol-dependent enzyme [Gordonia amarae]
MSRAGVHAAGELAATTIDLITGFTPQQWAADCACHGWRVQDLVGHMGFFFNFIADPELVLPDNPSGTSERLNDAAVAERADWAPEQVVEYYKAQSAAGLAALDALQSEQMRDQPIEMLDLGTYRLGQLSDAVAFDHLVHLTSDLTAPLGPITVDGEFPVKVSIDPAVDWMIAGMSPMCGTALAPTIDGPIGLRLTGATERGFVIAAGDDGTLVVNETGDLGDDVIVSDAIDFTRWSTKRTAWRSAVTIEGDRARVAPFLDALNII